MTTYTEDEFATHVLKTLGLVAAEETPSSADLEWIKTNNGAEIATLGAIGVPVWNGDALSIPQAYLNPLARYCGLAVQSSFGMASLAETEQARKLLVETLEKMAAPRGLAPMALRTDDAKRWISRGRFNFTSGI